MMLPVVWRLVRFQQRGHVPVAGYSMAERRFGYKPPPWTTVDGSRGLADSQDQDRGL